MLVDTLSFMTGSTLGNAPVESGSTLPSTSTADIGELYYLTGSTSSLYIFNGASWQTSASSLITSFMDRIGAITLQTSDIVTTLGFTPANAATSAPLLSPAFTGTPSAPTAAFGTNTSQLATTGFVVTQLDGGPQSTNLTETLTIAATAGITASGNIATGLTSKFMVLMVQAVNSLTSQNYSLSIYDGSTSGTLLYQASGITQRTYIDTGSFFVPALSTGNLFVQITNIDADAMSLAVSVLIIKIQ